MAFGASHLATPPTNVLAMASKPVILLIPGSFTTSAMYFPLQDILVEEGYEVYVNNLPSASRNAPEAPASLSDDAKFFSNIIRMITDQGKNIIVLGHSYGGLVASESAKGHSKAERCARDLKGGIIRIIFLAAIVLLKGQSLVGHQGMVPPSIIKTDEVGATASHLKP
jgi:alpha-beta hydrolase superfamily lysophospholipase